ncbi:MAG: hypothetical protein RLZZ230_703 [Candidatus Parcubacteria bacterium]|jgi:hypothetical protein
MKRKTYLILSALLLVVPIIAMAKGLVPCGGPGEPVCQLCYFVDQVNLIVKWLVGILTVVFAIIFVSSGLKLVTSTGNAAEMKATKDRITNAIIGLVIVMAAWLLIDFVMKSLVNQDAYGGPWNSVACIAQPESGILRIYQPVPNASRGEANPNAVGSLNQSQIDALAAISAPDDKVAAAAQAAGLDAAQTKNLQALMRVESGGCVHKTSPVGALGCMQIMPQTARQYDPSLKGLTDQQVKDKLINDNDYNISLGAQIYQDLYTTYGGNEQKVFAGYNGGPGSNSPSSDCPGQTRWQCVWDSPGCYGTANTSCTPNTGYVETRNYVNKVAAVSAKL